MAAKAFFVVVLSILLASSLIEAMVGNYQPIKNLKDPQVVAIANFAVTEHNKDAETKLEFVTILSGELQVVEGYNYKLVISAKYSGVAQPVNCLAIVLDQPWLKVTKLVSFQVLYTGHNA